MSWSEIKLALNSTALSPNMKPLDLLLLEEIEKLNDKIDAIRNNSAMVGDDLFGKTIRISSIRDASQENIENSIVVFDTDSVSYIECTPDGTYNGEGVFKGVFGNSTFDEEFTFGDHRKITVLNKDYISVTYID